MRNVIRIYSLEAVILSLPYYFTETRRAQVHNLEGTHKNAANKLLCSPHGRHAHFFLHCGPGKCTGKFHDMNHMFQDLKSALIATCMPEACVLRDSESLTPSLPIAGFLDDSHAGSKFILRFLLTNLLQDGQQPASLEPNCSLASTSLSPVEIIRKKRDGSELTSQEIKDFIAGFNHGIVSIPVTETVAKPAGILTNLLLDLVGRIPDYQMSALLMVRDTHIIALKMNDGKIVRISCRGSAAEFACDRRQYT
jgi:hypothetical protein